MGIFWELLQQDELEKQQKQADSIEDRVDLLEEELAKTKDLPRKTLAALEESIGKDIDGDGKLG
ncbi:MAG: hypothetical protein O2867_07155 [Bacteroidetes bacterium]|nr:hypothetical protein [Bacteroidota bacterium]